MYIWSSCCFVVHHMMNDGGYWSDIIQRTEMSLNLWCWSLICCSVSFLRWCATFLKVLNLQGGAGSAASPSMRRLSNSPAVARKGSATQHAGAETEVRGLLFCFSDGLAIAHKWVFGGNDSDPVIDMCEYPWKCVQVRPVVSSDANMHTFVVSSNAKGIASMKFYCKSALEQQAVLGKMDSIRSEQMAIRELKSNDLKRGMSIPRSMLAASERFKKENQREGGMGVDDGDQSE